MTYTPTEGDVLLDLDWVIWLVARNGRLFPMSQPTDEFLTPVTWDEIKNNFFPPSDPNIIEQGTRIRASVVRHPWGKMVTHDDVDLMLCGDVWMILDEDGRPSNLTVVPIYGGFIKPGWSFLGDDSAAEHWRRVSDIYDALAGVWKRLGLSEGASKEITGLILRDAELT